MSPYRCDSRKAIDLLPCSRSRWRALAGRSGWVCPFVLVSRFHVRAMPVLPSIRLAELVHAMRVWGQPEQPNGDEREDAEYEHRDDDAPHSVHFEPPFRLSILAGPRVGAISRPTDLRCRDLRTPKEQASCLRGPSPSSTPATTVRAEDDQAHPSRRCSNPPTGRYVERFLA